MERNNIYDFYKGFLMWGVVWGHCITALLNGDANNNGIHLILRTYDMPFFMLISGFFFSFSVQKYTLKTLVMNKITTILLPTIFWGLILSKFRDIDSFYFLWAVFLSALIIAVVQKAHLPSYSNIMIYGLILIILHIQPYSLWNLPYLFPYFVLGYYGVIIKKHYNVAWAIIVFVTCLCFWKSSYTIWNAGSDILSGGRGLALILTLRTIVAISGIIVIRELMDVLYAYFEKNKKSWFDFIILCGRNTLALYILHSVVLIQFVSRIIRVICSFFHDNPFNYNEEFLGYILAPLLAILMLWICIYVILWCQNHKYTDKLFGFKV